MFDFIRLQFLLGRITAEQVRLKAPKWITCEEAEQIVSGAGAPAAP